MTLRDALDPRRNSLNAIRLALAALVIVSHAPLAGYGDAPYAWGDLEIGGWAVGGFFAISGWLITSSRLRLRFGPYLWRRCLRIYPAYWVALVVTALVLAPLSTLAAGRWQPSAALHYITDNLSLRVFQPAIAGTLPDAPGPATWNLSLWTLAVEFGCYLAIGVALSFAVARRNPATALAALGVVIAVHAAVKLDLLPWAPAGVDSGLRLAAFFLGGAVLYLYADRIPAHWLLAATSAAVLVLLAWLGQVGLLAAPAIAYLMIWIGARLPTGIGRRNDISYGVYIYAFPVQRLLANDDVPRHGLVAYLALTIAITVPLAWASWLAVERPAMRLRALVPGEGQRRHAQGEPATVTRG